MNGWRSTSTNYWQHTTTSSSFFISLAPSGSFIFLNSSLPKSSQVNNKFKERIPKIFFLWFFFLFPLRLKWENPTWNNEQKGWIVEGETRERYTYRLVVCFHSTLSYRNIVTIVVAYLGPMHAGTGRASSMHTTIDSRDRSAQTRDLMGCPICWNSHLLELHLCLNRLRDDRCKRLPRNKRTANVECFWMYDTRWHKREMKRTYISAK